MAPGPIATNSATIIGYELSGLPGAICACIAIVLPPFLFLLAILKLFKKFHSSKIIDSAFYGLRPVIVGIIFNAAFRFAYGNGMIGGQLPFDVKSLLVMFASFFFTDEKEN